MHNETYALHSYCLYETILDIPVKTLPLGYQQSIKNKLNFVLDGQSLRNVLIIIKINFVFARDKVHNVFYFLYIIDNSGQRMVKDHFDEILTLFYAAIYLQVKFI